MKIVVMGVSGCGKSTVGALLAEDLGAPFLDGDSLHPQRNVDKMAAGNPLDDADRQPWLEEIGRRFAAAGPESLVIACSALKRAYRTTIRGGAPDVRFVHLHGMVDLLAERLAARPGHFMPASLLQSQLQTLEPLGPDEAGIVLDIAATPEALARQAAAWLEAGGIAA
ncbi:gluconokinase [Arthrobacter sedimenti]|uniref:gluconokinase n=1 Tax=Arthrobacter sedimenti TaxID=2694931 RepID=UPI001CDC6FC8|nr:gluconokinase [Arthrobacter sedimenti]